MTTPSAPTPFALSARILSGALMGALVIFGLVLFFVLEAQEAPPAWLVLAQLAAGVVVHFAVESVGYRTEPLGLDLSDADATTTAQQRWQSSMVLRFALCEVIAIASIVAAFVIPTNVLGYAVGAAVALALMAYHVWPWARPVGKVADALESAGRSSHLREAFGVPPRGPIQQF